MKVVAISQRIDVLQNRDEIRDALDQRLITLLLEAGYIPLPVPNTLHSMKPIGKCGYTSLDIWLATFNPAAIVFSGGNNIGEYIDRDITETRLMDYAKSQRLPVLGICRGAQMMAHWAGTALVSVHGHVQTRHQLSGQITGEVNSFHEFALADCPTNFNVLARSEDGSIEAIAHQTLPWEGWMWHPERENSFAARDINRIRVLFGG